MTDLSPEAQKAVEQVEKLLRLAAKNPNEQEAAAAAAKAQEILAKYNLDMSTVEANSGESSGKREDAKIKGGLYHYQRDLWRAVADLNFCMYWNMYVYDKTKTRVKRTNLSPRWKDPVYVRERVQGGYTFQHRIVGRTVNTAATRVMAQYLEATIERLTRERLNNDGSQFFTKWAVSFREGIAETVIDKIYDKRKQILAAEKRAAREAAQRAAAVGKVGTSSATALTLSSVKDSEKAANFDFVYGEGSWAERLARQAQAAERERLEEERYTKWAKENPEEARKLEEKERNRRRSYGPRDYADRKADNRDWGAFSAGNEAGKKVGIDPQTGTRNAGLLK